MITATELLVGAIRVVDYRCSAGPAEQAFTELHTGHPVSYLPKGVSATGCVARRTSWWPAIWS